MNYKFNNFCLYFSVLLLLSLTFTACDSAQKEEAREASCEAPLNPNGDSERALLMRKMTQLAEANAAALRSGGELVPYDGSFAELASSTGTMPVDEDFFKGMSASYLSNLEALYAAEPSDRIKLHNNLVQSCQDCHAQTCRGPLKRIDKMIVTEN
jgi:cytochrome c556